MRVHLYSSYDEEVWCDDSEYLHRVGTPDVVKATCLFCLVALSNAGIMAANRTRELLLARHNTRTREITAEELDAALRGGGAD